MIARPLLCLFTLLWIVSCGKSDQPAAATPPPEAPAPAPVVAAPEPPPPPPPEPPPPAKPALVLTPDLASSLVFVRVTVASMLPRGYTGVILRPDAITPPLPDRSIRRFIAVQLPDYDEKTLRDSHCLIQVLRQKFDPTGIPYVMQLLGTLIHFNAETHAAIVQITEDFPCSLEVGISPGTTTDTEALCVVQSAYTVHDDADPLASLPQQQTYYNNGKRVTLVKLPMQGTVDLTQQQASLKDAALTVEAAPGQDAARAAPAVVLTSEGRLAGFASPKKGTQDWQYASFAVPPGLEEQRLRYIIKGVEIRGTGGSYSMVIKADFSDPLQDYKYCRVAVKSLPSADFTPAADPAADQPSIDPDGPTTMCRMAADGSVEVGLSTPKDATEVFQLVQVQLMQHGETEGFFAPPFLVVTKMRGAQAYRTVLGLPGADDSTTMPGDAVTAAAAAASAASQELTTESRILYGVPVCEGREVLIKLDGAPYWKRLSLAKGQWLPLPDDDLSHACMAGNKDALFVLQPVLGEIRRYNAATLALEKSATLPGGISCQNLAAGCLSDDAPLAIVVDAGLLACDPATLKLEQPPTLQKTSSISLSPSDVYYQASGDGMAVWGCSTEGGSGMLPVFTYRGVLSGYSRANFNYASGPTAGTLPTVAASCRWDGGIHYPVGQTGAHHFLFQGTRDRTKGTLANSPSLYVVRLPEKNTAGGILTPPQCAFYSYYSSAPWATVDIPEAGDVPLNSWETFTKRVWLDQGSLTVAIWHHDQTITLHKIDRSTLPEQAKPVLLNYPDCYVPRGSSFHFVPHFLGTSPAVTTTETPAGFAQGADGSMDWTASDKTLPQQILFGVNVAGRQENQTPYEFKIALQLGGEHPVMAVPASLLGASAEDAIESPVKINAAVPLVPLKSRNYTSDRPIRTVESGLDDYLALNLQDKTLALFSLKDWAVVGSYSLGDTSAAYLAGDVVFIYNSLSRELTRHTLPDFNVTHLYKMPGAVQLRGLSVGTQPTGPVTLLQEEDVPVKTPTKYGPKTTRERTALILDMQTLAPGNWAPYKPKEGGKSVLPINMTPITEKSLPAQCPSSSDGRVLACPNGVLMISPAVTVDYPFTDTWMHYHPMPSYPPTASPTGYRVFVDGQIYRSGQPPQKICESSQGPALSPCGDYISWIKKENNGRQQIRLTSADDARPLLNLAGVSVLKLYDGELDYKRRQVTPLGDKNLLTVLSRGGTIMQVITLDVAAVYRITEPKSAYVTSHPFPFVAEGRTLEYQVTVNNPDAVLRYELRDKVPGASITPEGHLTYQAPAQLEASQQVSIPILLRFHNNEVALHQFPIYVISLKPTSPKKP